MFCENLGKKNSITSALTASAEIVLSSVMKIELIPSIWLANSFFLSFVLSSRWYRAISALTASGEIVLSSAMKIELIPSIWLATSFSCHLCYHRAEIALSPAR